MLRGRCGKWCPLAHLSLEGHLCECQLSQIQEEGRVSSHIPQANAQLALSALGLLACFHSKSRALPSSLYPSQAGGPLNLQCVRPTGCKNEIQPLTFSQPMSLGKCLTYVYALCSTLSPFSITRAPSPLQHLQSLSSPKQHLHTSYLP